LFSVGDASPLQSHSNGQVRLVKAQKCRFEYSIFSQLPISVYILKISKLSMSLMVFSQTDSVSNGENESQPNFSANSMLNSKTFSKTKTCQTRNSKNHFKSLKQPSPVAPRKPIKPLEKSTLKICQNRNCFKLRLQLATTSPQLYAGRELRAISVRFAIPHERRNNSRIPSAARLDG
jgi:hypothetical protein